MAKTFIRVDGLRELEAALSELPKSVGKNTLKRVLIRAGEPIAEAARRLVPDGPTGRLKRSIAVSAKIVNTVGKAEFAAAMKAGEGTEAATSALRAARRAASASGEGSFAEVYVGPGRLPYAHLVEFGSVHNAAKPFMRPAWDQQKNAAFDIVKRDLGDEIIKSAKRVARRNARKASTAGAAAVASALDVE